MAIIWNVHKAELNDAQTLIAWSDTLRSIERLLMDVTGDMKSRELVRSIQHRKNFTG